MPVGAAKGWNLRKIDISAACLKSDPAERKIWVIPPMEANSEADEICMAKKAVYCLADGPSDFFHTLATSLSPNPILEQ